MPSHVVRRLPVDTGQSGWKAIGERLFPARSLDQHLNADWLVIGGGFAGLSAARRLTQVRPGDKVIVLDAMELAGGPAGRNSGYMIDVPHNLSTGEYSGSDEAATKLEIAQNRYAIAFAAQAAADYSMCSDTFDPSGKVNAAATPRGLELNQRYADSLSKIGERHSQLGAAAMRQLTGSEYYLGGLYTPGAVLIQPADYIRKFAAGLGPTVDILENSPVLELQSKEKLWRARTPNGSVTAPKAVLAVNGHVQDFGHFKGRLMHVFTYASMTEGFKSSDFGPNTSGSPRWALLPADPMGATVRKVESNGLSRIVIRTRFTYDPSLRVSQDRVDRVAAEQRRSFDARFPALARVPMEFSWAGRLCLSRNNAPAFGEIEENLYSACCENGLGTVKSTLAGIMAIDLATRTQSDALSAFMRHASPSRIPPEPFAWIGINSAIRWQELRAGREG